MIYVYLHGHTQIFALGIFVGLGISPCSNFATLTALCALCENESNVSLWFWQPHVRFVLVFAGFYVLFSPRVHFAQT